MSYQEDVQSITIQLEIVPEDAQQQDIADVDEVGRNIVDYIRERGYSVKPAYTGKMGGPLFDIFMQAYMVLQDNREVLATAAATLEFLSATLGFINDHKREPEKEKPQLISAPMLIEISIPTSEGPWIVKAPDAETAIKVIEQLPVTSPEKLKKVIRHGKTKITTIVPKRKRNLPH
jgi:hypothetical protein